MHLRLVQASGQGKVRVKLRCPCVFLPLVDRTSVLVEQSFHL